MRSSLSALMLESVYAQNTDEVFVCLVKMEHSSWPSSVRFVSDVVALTHNLEVYDPYPFNMQLPDDEDEGLPILKWVSDNTTSDTVALLRSTTGSISVTVSWVLVSEPEIVQAGPFDVELNGVEYDMQTIQGALTIEPVLDDSYGHMNMTPANAPGLF